MSALFTSDADRFLVKFRLLLALVTLPAPVYCPCVHKYFCPSPPTPIQPYLSRAKNTWSSGLNILNI